MSRPVCLALILLLAVSAGPAQAEERGPAAAEPDSDQYDMFYDAMLRSIELDRNRWKSFSRSMESGPWFYDTQSLKRTGKKVTAQVTVYPHPNRTELYRSVYPEHTKIRKIVFLTEIDCSRHTYWQPQISVYGYYRELLAEHSAEDSKQSFSPIKPGTTTDTLRGLLCGPDRKKKR
jgi:hypothetical protein